MANEKSPETRLAFVDGRDALAYLIIRPGENGDGVVIDAEAHGISKPQAAYVLRHVADQWDPSGPPKDVTVEDVTAQESAGECPHLTPGAVHRYVSTACQHGLHDQCRRVCKFCGVSCRCKRQHGGDNPRQEPMTEAAIDA